MLKNNEHVYIKIGEHLARFSNIFIILKIKTLNYLKNIYNFKLKCIYYIFQLYFLFYIL